MSNLIVVGLTKSRVLIHYVEYPCSLFIAILKVNLFDFWNSLKMSSISLLNPKAETARAAQALAINISASKGLQDVMKTNLGPKGTMKM